MKEIPLTKGHVAIVDDEDYERVSQWKWCALSSGSHVYGYRCGNLLMHRFIMDAPKGMVVDHINGDTLDNRRKNLRVVTQQQNTMNQKLSKNNTSGFRGVYFQQGKWVAAIWNNRKSIYLGRFEKPEEAAAAYDNAAMRLYGDIARLNFPETA